MSKECEVCGRSIRTGRKYCFIHRHGTEGRTYKIKSTDSIIILPIVFIMLLIIYFYIDYLDFSKKSNTVEDSRQNEVIMLTNNYCQSEIRDNKVMDILDEYYFNDKNAALEWAINQGNLTYTMIQNIGKSGFVSSGQTLDEKYNYPIVVFHIISQSETKRGEGFVVCNIYGYIDDNLNWILK